jgi:hypothetical protein
MNEMTYDFQLAHVSDRDDLAYALALVLDRSEQSPLEQWRVLNK